MKTNHTRRLIQAAASALALAIPSLVTASNYQWDVNDAATGLGGTGSWDTSSAFWDLVPDGIDDGTAATVAYTFTNLDRAIFGGTAGTVTLGTGVTLNALQFDTAGYTITGDTLTMAGTTPTITANQNATIASTLANTVGLTKAGTGTLTITAANAYAANTTLSAGTLQIGDGTNATARAGTGVLAVGGNILILNLNGTATLGNSSVTSTSGGTIQNSGTGKVTLANGSLLGTTDGSTGGIVLANNLTSSLTFKGDVTINNVGTNQVIQSVAAGATARFTSVAPATSSTWWIGTTVAANALSLDIASGKLVQTNNAQTAGALYYQNLSGAGSFTFNSGADATSGNILGSSTLGGTLTVNRPIFFGNGGSGGFAGSTTIANNKSVTFNSTTDNTYSGNMSGSGTIEKKAANTLTITGNNSGMTGGTIISGGVLSVSVIADTGTTSQIGNWSTGGNPYLGILGGGTLRYTGSAAATTGRYLWMDQTGGGTFDITDAAGSLSFTNTANGTRSQRITKAGAGALTIAGVISTANGAVTVSAGTLNLTGTSTYTGTTLINGGTLALTGANGAITGVTATTIATGGTLKIDNSSASAADRFGSGTITLTGGTVEYFHNGAALTDYSESLGVVTVGTGGTITTSQAASGQTSTLTLGGLVGFANFTGTGLGVDASNKIVITGMAAGTIIGSYNTTGLAVYDTTLGVTQAISTDVAFGGTISDLPTTNIRLSGGLPVDGNVVLAGSPTTINTMVQNQADATTIDNTSQTLRLGAAGAIILPSGKAALTIGTAPDSGTLTAGGADATAGTVTLTNHDTTSAITINSVIADNGATVGVVTTGAGRIVLATVNTYTGTTVLGAAATEFAGPTQTLTSAISGTGGLVKSNAASTLTLSGANTYTGGTTVLDGTLRNGLTNTLATTGAMIINGGTYDLNGYDQTVGRFSGTGGTLAIGAKKFVIDNGATSASQFDGAISVAAGAQINVGNTSNTGKNVTFTGTMTTSGTGAVGFSSYRSGYLTITGKITGTAGITLNGNVSGVAISDYRARLRLENVNNDYSGNTTIQGGGGGTWGGTQGQHMWAAKLGTGNVTVTADWGGSGQLYALGANIFGPASTLTLGGYSSSYFGKLHMQGFSQSIAGLTGTGTAYIGSTAAATLTINNATNFTCNSTIQDAISLVKTGIGTQTLTGANSYTGGTTISAGTISFANGSLGSTGTIMMNGGALQWNGTNTQDVSARLTMVNTTTATFDTNSNNVTFATAFGGNTSGVLAKTGNGTLTLSAANTYSGGTTITAGILSFASDSLGSTGTILMNGGTLQWATGNTVDVSPRLAMVNGTPATFSTNGNDITFASPIGSSSTASLTKSGAGTLTLAGINTYGGSTTLNAGTLRATNASALGSSTALTLNGGTLELAADGAVQPMSLTLGGNAGIVLDRATSGAGFTTTFTNLTSTSGDRTLTFTKGSNVTDIPSVMVNGTLSISGRTTTLDVGGSVIVNIGGSSAGGAQNITMIKNGAGTLILSGGFGTWDSGGATQLNNGTLELRDLMGDTTQYRAPLSLAGGTTLRLVKNTGTNFMSNTTVNGSMEIVADRLASAATSTTHSLGTLSIGASTLTVTRGAGITGAGIGGLTFTGAITLTGNATFDVGTSAALNLNGAVGGAFAITKQGPGTMTLASANTYSGTTSVQAGTLLLTGSVAGPANVGNASGAAGTLAGTGTITGETTVLATGVLSPGNGNVATLNFSDNVTLQADATYAVDVTSSTTSDKIVLAASKTLATAGSTVAITATGHTFVAGDTYDIADSTTITGVPAITPAIPAAGLVWDTSTFTTDGKIKVMANNTYTSWINSFFPGETNPDIIGPNADPENDGIPNSVEMVLGGDPKLGMDTALLPTIELVTEAGILPAIPADNYLMFTYRRADQAQFANLGIKAEYDADLVPSWTMAVDVDGLLNNAPGVQILVDDNWVEWEPAATVDTDRVRVFVPLGGNTELFGRLNVVVPAP